MQIHIGTNRLFIFTIIQAFFAFGSQTTCCAGPPCYKFARAGRVAIMVYDLRLGVAMKTQQVTMVARSLYQ